MCHKTFIRWGTNLAKGPSISEIQQTLVSLVRPGLSPKDLFRETKRLHPQATRKEILHAAFSSIIAIADADFGKAMLLQDFALKQRGGEDK